MMPTKNAHVRLLIWRYSGLAGPGLARLYDATPFYEPFMPLEGLARPCDAYLYNFAKVFIVKKNKRW
jgi:hypothetical protein